MGVQVVELPVVNDLMPAKGYTVFRYKGDSMAGTFCYGDVLFAVPTLLSKLHPGDVVIFCPAQSAPDGMVVHRVTACTGDSVITRGDARILPDATALHPSQLRGRVVNVQRGNKVYTVWGGFAGRAWASYTRLRRRLLALGRIPYRWLRASGVVRHLWRPPVRFMTLATEQGSVVKYLHGGKTVAAWQPETQSYWCRKPYDLVLDPPGPTTNEQRINE